VHLSRALSVGDYSARAALHVDTLLRQLHFLFHAVHTDASGGAHRCDAVLPPLCSVALPLHQQQRSPPLAPPPAAACGLAALGKLGISATSSRRSMALKSDDSTATGRRASAVDGENTPLRQRILAGAHYFAGWSRVQGPGNFSHFHGVTPTGQKTVNWFQTFPERTPLLGLYSTEATVAREVAAADNVLDFFDMLYFDAGSDCGPNSRGRVCH
jgi:hypothetical protein